MIKSIAWTFWWYILLNYFALCLPCPDQGLEIRGNSPTVTYTILISLFYLTHSWYFEFFFIRFFFIIICFWLCWVFVAACGLSLVVASRDYSSLGCMGFSLRWLLLLWSTGSRRVGFSSCGAWALEHRLSSCGSWA